MSETLEEKIERIWRKDLPCCGSCGWCPTFYEVKDDLEISGRKKKENYEVYWAPCISKDHEDSYSHRGYYLYVPKEEL